MPTATPVCEDDDLDVGETLLLAGAILAGSALVALGAARIGVPALVAFLGLGMLLGSDGPGGIHFDDAEFARTVGMISLAAIIFEGGLSTSWRRLRQIAAAAALLSTVGVLMTALLTGAVAYYLFDLSWLESILLGAVVSSTDAAATFATFRYTNIRLRLARTLEAESGVNDPVAVALTIGLIEWIQMPNFAFPELVTLLIQQLGLGLLVGVVLGALAMWVFARLPPAIGAFAPVASVAAGALSFGAADVIGGSGFLAIYLVGLAIGSTPSRHRQQMVAFHEGLAFLAQVVMFVVLGLLVFPSDLPAVALPGLALAVLLVVLVRPIAVYTSTALNKFTARERGLLGWAGLRGATPIVLATFVLSSEVGKAETIFNVIFFVVLVSALLQGTTLEWMAKQLGLVDPRPVDVVAPLEVSGLGSLELVDFDVAGDHAIAGVAVREIGLPRSALIAVIARAGETIPPRGSTVIEPGDRLFVLIPRSMRPELEDVFFRWRRRV